MTAHFPPPGLDTLQRNTGRLIVRVLWHEFAAEGFSQDGWRHILHGLHPDTVVRWHRQGFRLYWRWKSRGPNPGRPPIDKALRKLIREMQATNTGWGAPRIHGELLKLGLEVSQAVIIY